MDDNTDDNDSPPRNRPRNRTANSSKYADRPYRVGKGKPPAEHQFPKGGPSPHPQGRPRGSSRTSSLEKLLRRRVMVTDKDGRRVRKSICEVIDHKLVEMAAGGNLKAIKLTKDIELQLRRSGLLNEPTALQLEKEASEFEERKALAARLINNLEQQAARKKAKAPRWRPKTPRVDEPEGGQ